ncbi:hypothetical protein K1719_016450 [Acacia pycnantha]|nr:hypothetical protein K1719_016450 [Acacia pycnantha]
MWTAVEDRVLVECLVTLRLDQKLMADSGFKAGYANALQSMMEERIPGCGIKATPHITSGLKTLKRLWQAAYDIVYEPNTSGFGWNLKTKLVTVDKEVWDEYLKAHPKAKEFPMARVKMTDDRLVALGITKEDLNNYREHKAKLCRCGRVGSSKYKSQEGDNEYDAMAKWKHDLDAKEAKKNQRAAKRKEISTASVKVTRPGDSDSDASPNSSKQSSPNKKNRGGKTSKGGKQTEVVSD